MTHVPDFVRTATIQALPGTATVERLKTLFVRKAYRLSLSLPPTYSLRIAYMSHWA